MVGTCCVSEEKRMRRTGTPHLPAILLRAAAATPSSTPPHESRTSLPLLFRGEEKATKRRERGERASGAGGRDGAGGAGEELPHLHGRPTLVAAAPGPRPGRHAVAAAQARPGNSTTPPFFAPPPPVLPPSPRVAASSFPDACRF